MSDDQHEHELDELADTSGMQFTVNDDGTIDIVNVVDPEIEAMAADYLRSLDEMT